MTYVFTFFTIILQFLSATDSDSPCRDLAEIVRKPHGNQTFRSSEQKQHDTHATSLWTPRDYLRSLRSCFGTKGQCKIVCCPYDQRAVPIQGSCNLPAKCLQACDFSKFVKVKSETKS